METQKTLKNCNNLEKKEQCLWYYAIKVYDKATQSKQHGTGIKTDLLNNIIEGQEINLCLQCQLIFDKEGKVIQWGKESPFNKWC